MNPTRLNGSPSAPADRRAPRPALPGALLAAAAGLGAAALINARAATRANRDHPPAGRFVEQDGVRLHYVERGQGAPVILIHGNVVDHQDWRRAGVFDALSATNRVIAFDRPGFGHSDRPRDRVWTPQAQGALLLDAAASLGAQRPVLVGHSLGSTVALAAALAAPDRIGGLVLVSGYYFPTPRVDSALTAPVALPVLGDLLRYTVSPILGRLGFAGLAAAMFAPQPPPTGFSRAVRPLALRPSQIRATSEDGTLMVPAAAAMAPRYQRLRLPAVLFAADGDRIVGLQTQTERLAATLAHAELIAVPGKGHMAHYGAGDAIADAVERVRARAEADQGAGLSGEA